MPGTGLPFVFWRATSGGRLRRRCKGKSYGRHLAQECTSCHRIDGVENGIPSIVGWDADRFVATIEFYRMGERTNPVMVSVVKLAQ